MKSDQPPAVPRKRRRVVFVEYDITPMTESQVDTLLLALASSAGVSFRVEVQEACDPSANTSLTRR